MCAFRKCKPFVFKFKMSILQRIFAAELDVEEDSYKRSGAKVIKLNKTWHYKGKI